MRFLLTRENASGPRRLIVGMEVAYMFMLHLGLTCRRKTLELNRAVAAVWNFGIVSYALFQSLDQSSLFAQYSPMPPSFMIAVWNESIFYGVHLIEEMLARNTVYTLHHAGALCTIATGLHYGYHQPMIVMFGVFTASSPFLYISKWAHHNQHDACAKVMFALFSAVFFVSRIIACPIALKYTVVDAFYVPDINRVAYVTCNTILCSLYVLQWHWFKKIVGILKLQVFRRAIKTD